MPLEPRLAPQPNPAVSSRHRPNHTKILPYATGAGRCELLS